MKPHDQAGKRDSKLRPKTQAHNEPHPVSTEITAVEREVLLKLVNSGFDKATTLDMEASVDEALFLLDLYGQAYEREMEESGPMSAKGSIVATSCAARHDACLNLENNFQRIRKAEGHLCSQLLALRALAGLPLSEPQTDRLKCMVMDLLPLFGPSPETTPAAAGKAEVAA